jgi:hypothetical protein
LPEFPPQFIQELTEILGSQSVRSHYDHAGRIVEDVVPFTSEWRLEPIDFEPGSGRSRVVVSLSGADRVVRAVMDAGDFPGLIHGEHDPAFNSTRYSDLAYYASILFMELILTRSPADVKASEVRIRWPP